MRTILVSLLCWVVVMGCAGPRKTSVPAQDLVRNTDSAKAYFLSAAQLFEEKKYEEALTAYDKSFAFNPRVAVPLVFKAEALCHLGRCEESLVACEQAIQIKYNYARTWEG